jgi:putative ABC transport system substrate-binding protein
MIAVLNDPNSSESQSQSRDAAQVARTMNQPIVPLDIASAADIDRVFATMGERKVAAFFASGSPFLNAHRHKLGELALQHKLPGMYANRNYPEAGGLLSYGASILDAYRQTGVYVSRVLKGATSADLPVLLPSKFEFVINLKTAKAMGLAVPDRLLALADQVIE